MFELLELLPETEKVSEKLEFRETKYEIRNIAI